MKILLCAIIVAMCSCSEAQRTESAIFYSFSNYGEENFIAMKLRIAGWRPFRIDSVWIISSQFEDLPDYLNDGPPSGKKIFGLLGGKALATIRCSSAHDTLEFATSRLSLDEVEPSAGFYEFSFRGVKGDTTINGILLQRRIEPLHNREQEWKLDVEFGQ